jgi:hypothetical protein
VIRNEDVQQGLQIFNVNNNDAVNLEILKYASITPKLSFLQLLNRCWIYYKIQIAV